MLIDLKEICFVLLANSFFLSRFALKKEIFLKKIHDLQRFNKLLTSFCQTFYKKINFFKFFWINWVALGRIP